MRRRFGLAAPLVVLGALALAFVAPAHAGGPQGAYYANDADGVFWFMHISDLHVGCKTSIEPGPMYDPQNLIFMLNDAVDVIAPAFVVATGDLVNGSRNNIPTAGQTQAEWNDYKAIYTAAQAAHPVPYYDIVGNHDEYSPRWPNDECPSLHWYLDNSYRGQLAGAAHFSWTHTTALGDYFFYGLNTTGNCVDAFTGGDGALIDTEYEAVKAALETNADAELQFVFAHQGPTEPTNSGRLVDEFVKNSTFYLHGHQHEYQEYLQGNGTGDIVVNQVDSTGKANANNLAVGVVDHNAFIYRATSTADPWPFVIVTAPVASRLRNLEFNPWAYDVCKDRVNPVRALVFAPSPPTGVTVQIGAAVPVPMTQVDAWLWTAQIDTSMLSEGEQTVTVTALAGGKTKSAAVAAEFYAGPCAAQDDGGVPPQDAGGGGDGAVLADGGGAEAAVDASGGDGGVGGEGGGCGCRAAAGNASAAGFGLLALLLVVGRARGRRRPRGDR